MVGMATTVTDVYDLPQEHKDFRDTIRQIVDERVAPARGRDRRDGRVPVGHPQAASPSRTSSRLPFAEEYGGTGTGTLMLQIAVEEIAQGVRVERADPDGPGARHAADPAVRLRRAEGALAAASARRGEWSPAFCAVASPRPARTRRRCARPPSATATSGSSTARRTGSRTPAIADFYVVFADRPTARTGRITAFVVEKDRAGLLGRQARAQARHQGLADRLAGLRGRARAGREPDRRRRARACRSRSARSSARASAPPRRRSASPRARPTTPTSYAKERIAFGKPINELQGIQFKLADMETRTAAARELLYKACAMADRNEPGLGKYTSMAKLFASDTAMAVTVEAVQVLGGYGYVTEYPVERMMRDAKITQIYEGTNEIQRARDRPRDEGADAADPAHRLRRRRRAVRRADGRRACSQGFSIDPTVKAIETLAVVGSSAAVLFGGAIAHRPADGRLAGARVRGGVRAGRRCAPSGSRARARRPSPTRRSSSTSTPTTTRTSRSSSRDALDELPDLLRALVENHNVAVVISDGGRRRARLRPLPRRRRDPRRRPRPDRHLPRHAAPRLRPRPRAAARAR